MLSFFDKALLNMLTIAAVRGKKIWNGTVRDRRDTFPWLYDVRAERAFRRRSSATDPGLNLEPNRSVQRWVAVRNWDSQNDL